MPLRSMKYGENDDKALHFMSPDVLQTQIQHHTIAYVPLYPHYVLYNPSFGCLMFTVFFPSGGLVPKTQYVNGMALDPTG